MRRPLPLVLLPFVLLAGCGGSSGNDGIEGEDTKSPYSFSGTRTGTADVLAGTVLQRNDVPATGRVSNSGVFHLTVELPNDEIRTLDGAVANDGSVASATLTVTNPDGTTATQAGRGNFVRNGNATAINLGFTRGSNPPNYTDDLYLVTLQAD